jgi:hypothetical protein
MIPGNSKLGSLIQVHPIKRGNLARWGTVHTIPYTQHPPPCAAMLSTHTVDQLPDFQYRKKRNLIAPSVSSIYENTAPGPKEKRKLH